MIKFKIIGYKPSELSTYILSSLSITIIKKYATQVLLCNIKFKNRLDYTYKSLTVNTYSQGIFFYKIRNV